MRFWYLLEESVYKTPVGSLGIQRDNGYSSGTVRGSARARLHFETLRQERGLRRTSSRPAIFVQSSYMASIGKRSAPRYTEDHARAGLDYSFPEIETWPNQFPGYEIVIDDPEFTSVCPKTGLPDFGVILLRYEPRKDCLELKSYKEYLFSYRNLGIFQENVVNQVLKDVVKACNPVWATVRGEFRPRGGISTIVEARWPRQK